MKMIIQGYKDRSEALAKGNSVPGSNTWEDTDTVWLHTESGEV